MYNLKISDDLSIYRAIGLKAINKIDKLSNYNINISNYPEEEDSIVMSKRNSSKLHQNNKNNLLDKFSLSIGNLISERNYNDSLEKDTMLWLVYDNDISLKTHYKHMPSN